MYFQIKKNILLEALQQLQSVIEKKNNAPVLSSALFCVNQNQLSITATDLEIGIKINISVEEAKDGKVAIPLKKLIDFVKELDDEPIYFTEKENAWVHLKCAKMSCKIMGISGEQFSQMPKFEENAFVPLEKNAFHSLILRTGFCISTDTAKPQLNGVCLEVNGQNAKMTSTDGHRLSLAYEKIFATPQEYQRLILPIKGVQAIKKMMEHHQDDFFIAFDQGFVFFKVNSVFMFIRMIEGEYPDYSKVLSFVSTKIIRVHRLSFMNALKRVSMIINAPIKTVTFFITEKEICLYSSNTEFGEAKEEIGIIAYLDSLSDPLEITFNAKYILDYLAVMSSEEIEIHFQNQNTGCNLKETFEHASHYEYVFMPMNLY
jgi:DNA polymerase-3 subunit beta